MKHAMIALLLLTAVIAHADEWYEWVGDWVYTETVDEMTDERQVSLLSFDGEAMISVHEPDAIMLELPRYVAHGTDTALVRIDEDPAREVSIYSEREYVVILDAIAEDMLDGEVMRVRVRLTDGTRTVRFSLRGFAEVYERAGWSVD